MTRHYCCYTGSQAILNTRFRCRISLFFYLPSSSLQLLLLPKLLFRSFSLSMILFFPPFFISAPLNFFSSHLSLSSCFFPPTFLSLHVILIPTFPTFPYLCNYSSHLSLFLCYFSSHLSFSSCIVLPIFPSIHNTVISKYHLTFFPCFIDSHFNFSPF